MSKIKKSDKPNKSPTNRVLNRWQPLQRVNANFNHDDRLSHLFALENGDKMRVDCLSPGIFRIRVGADDCMHESGLNRYGIIQQNAPDLTADAVNVAKTKNGWSITTPKAELRIDAKNGKVVLLEENDTLFESDDREVEIANKGYRAYFRLRDDDKLYGLGHVDCNIDSGNEGFQRRGKVYEMVQTSQVSYAPIPFLMSIRGWAIFMNTTWFHSIDAGAADPNILSFKVDGGNLDYYLMTGEYPKGLLERYTWITGKPALLPEWIYGFVYGASSYETFAKSTASDLLDFAYNLRAHEIPCNSLFITDWMEDDHGDIYNFSLDKDWSKSRYNIPAWMRHDYVGRKTPETDANFLGALKHMGYKIGLWLCSDYDMTEHEELQYIATLNKEDARAEIDRLGFIDPKLQEESQKGLGCLNIVDPRLRHPVYSDRYTKLGEPWFEHLKKFINDGVRWFFQDGSNIGLKHPDRKWKNGMDDSELHNLHCVIYAKQMTRSFHEYTGKRPMLHMARQYAGSQQYISSWTGDNDGGRSPMNTIINFGFSALSNVTTNMDYYKEQGIHFGFFQGWSQINGGIAKPWHYGKHLEELFKFYAKLRYRLLPYIYSMAHVANQSGYPIVRAMPMVFQDDPKSDELFYQYMFGDAFLVSAFTDDLYLPGGTWTNYWTGECLEGPVTIPATYPEDRGGPLFVRAGAIIPMASQDMAYWREKPMDSLTIDIFPGEREEAFTLYEDDGDTEQYKNGKIASTVFNQTITNGELTITVSPRQGQYDAMPAHREYRFKIHCSRPEQVHIDDGLFADWHHDVATSLLILPPIAAVAGNEVKIRLHFSSGITLLSLICGTRKRQINPF